MAELRSNIPKALWPGVKAFWGLNEKMYMNQLEMVFTMHSSKKAYEEDVEVHGLGLAREKPENQAITYDALTQGVVTRYTNRTYAHGTVVSREEIADNQYMEFVKKRTDAIYKSLHETKEIVHADVFESGFTRNGSDGVPLFSTDHPVKAGLDNQSNILATPADLSDSSLKDLLTIIHNAYQSDGKRQMLQPICLVVPSALQYIAVELTKSTNIPNYTNNNNINAIRYSGIFQKDPIIYRYLTSDSAWFVKTDCPDGLKSYKRMGKEINPDSLNDSFALKYSGVERYSAGYSNWRGIYGSQGA